MAANGINAVRRTRSRRGGCSTSQRNTACMCSSACRGSSTSPSSTTGGCAERIERRVRDAVRACAGHPAVLGYALGNEIPAPIVRWHGAARVEDFLQRLYSRGEGRGSRRARHLRQLPVDRVPRAAVPRLRRFNVYLEEPETACALSRTAPEPRRRPAAGDGGDRARQPAQRRSTARPRRSPGRSATAFAAGCAGAFVFAWTDEWHRGGVEIDDWDFGLVDRQRRAKPALGAVRGGLRGHAVPV